MIANRDYRHSKDYDPYDAENAVVPARKGSNPTVTKSKLAGKCSHGYALFFVNNDNHASHVVTPIDTSEIVAHKTSCREGEDLTR